MAGLHCLLDFACKGALAGILSRALTMPKELDQPCLTFGKRVPAPLRDHEGEGAHVPCAPFKFDERSFRDIFGNHMTRHVPPAQASLKQIVLCAQVIHPPLAFAGDALLRLFGIGLIVGYDKLDVPAKFLPRDRPRDCSQRMRWRTDGHHLHFG